MHKIIIKKKNIYSQYIFISKKQAKRKTENLQLLPSTYTPNSKKKSEKVFNINFSYFYFYKCTNTDIQKYIFSRFAHY